MTMKTILAAALATVVALPAFAENQAAPALSAVEALFGSQNPVAPLSAADEILERAKQRCGGQGTAYLVCQHAAALETAIYAAEAQAMDGIVKAWAATRVAEADTTKFRAFVARDGAALDAAKAKNALALEEGRMVLTDEHEVAIAALELKVEAAIAAETQHLAVVNAHDLMISALEGLLAERQASSDVTQAALETLAARLKTVCNDGQPEAGTCEGYEGKSIQELIDQSKPN